jgi:hypothetical protein
METSSDDPAVLIELWTTLTMVLTTWNFLA